MKSLKVTHFFKAALWLGLIVLALLTRFYHLENKPIHFDEGINGWFVLQMQTLGFYKYDPNNYHGPLYFYLLRWSELLWGQSLAVLRTVPAIFSFFSIFLFSYSILTERKMQRWMIFFVFLSPAFIFFGRSGIHEMPFVFFQLLLALGLLRWLERPDSKALVLAVTGFWGLLVLKETFVITLLCLGLGILSLGLGEVRKQLSWQKACAAWTPLVRSWVLFLALFFVALYTGFFKNPWGLVDFFKALVPWLKTGVHGHGHEKEFAYWVKVLWQAEPLVLLGIVLALPGVVGKNKGLRVVSVFSLAQLLIYSLIPYKTVWCILSLVWGFYFVLALQLDRSKKNMWVLLGPVVLLAALNIYSAYRSAFKVPIDMTHPYVYVNSTYDLVAVQSALTSAVQNNPQLLHTNIQIGHKEQWPWPWLVRSFTKVDYNVCGKRVSTNAFFYICDADDAPTVEAQLTQPYWKVTVELRQAKEGALVYFRKSDFPTIPLQGHAVLVGVDGVNNEK
ncbi:MAG: TIGR03663 family protein [Bdellovibrio sp.]|nr:TIGR03663 family protein [Bdellovibrio sp.]